MKCDFISHQILTSPLFFMRRMWIPIGFRTSNDSSRSRNRLNLTHLLFLFVPALDRNPSTFSLETAFPRVDIPTPRLCAASLMLVVGLSLRYSKIATSLSVSSGIPTLYCAETTQRGTNANGMVTVMIVSPIVIALFPYLSTMVGTP